MIGHCKHYSLAPGGRVECARGVDIRKHVGGPALGWMRRLPCINPDVVPGLPPIDPVPCALREFPTSDEVNAARAEFAESVCSILAGECPQCGSELITEENERSSLSRCSNCPDVFAHTCKRIGP